MMYVKNVGKSYCLDNSNTLTKKKLLLLFKLVDKKIVVIIDVFLNNILNCVSIYLVY